VQYIMLCMTVQHAIGYSNCLQEVSTVTILTVTQIADVLVVASTINGCAGLHIPRDASLYM
jgi:hypothetical protein